MLTCLLDQALPADECAGETDECLVEVEVAFPSDSQAADLAEQGNHYSTM
jgi:hypothetical protein